MLIFVFNLKSIAQPFPPIQLDRPDQTECSFIVPKGYIQAENGFSYENINKDEKAIVYPSTLWKYGLSKKVELRLITELVTEKQKDFTVSGLTPIKLGFKVNISQEKGIIPVTSLIVHLVIPGIASQSFISNYYAPSFRFTMQNTLSKKFSLGYNLGAEWDEQTHTPTYIYTLTTGYSITEKLNSYLEAYGFLAKNEWADHRIDGGFTYLLNEDMMLDISGGFGITKFSPINYVALGFSYRFNTKALKFSHKKIFYREDNKTFLSKNNVSAIKRSTSQPFKIIKK